MNAALFSTWRQCSLGSMQPLGNRLAGRCLFSTRTALRTPQTRLPGILPKWEQPPQDSFAHKFMRIRKFRPMLFCGSFGLATYIVCSLKTETDTFAAATLLHQQTGRIPSSADMWMLRERAVFQKWSTNGAALSERLKQWPKLLAYHVGNIYVITVNSWLRAGEAKRTALKIVALNTLIFAAWKLPRLKPFMMSHFTHYALSGKSYTMLTSVFSHATFWHLAFNSIALVSFAPSAFRALFDMKRAHAEETGIQEASPLYHFLAFYVAAGLFSSLASHLAHAVRLQRFAPDLTKPGSAALAMKRLGAIRPSLGASGALYAMVMGVALCFPNTGVNIMLIPIDIPIGVAVTGTVILDIMGLLRGWRTFDHVAHLGGAAFGLLYFWWDNGRIWEAFRKAAQNAREDVAEEEEEHRISRSRKP
ncbi:hypothetical protein FRB94_002726 [Tulasnella sp. JGI-2019a]|nr:hypothetical protein FRB94_002726 [Tulasnella sp. JGI-2019a]